MIVKNEKLRKGVVAASLEMAKLSENWLCIYVVYQPQAPKQAKKFRKF